MKTGYKVGNYDIEDLQEVMLEMMADVDRVCRENNINYILDGGTMLGAVRHKGFIPWDDDLDIAMLREDYEKFIKISNECLNTKYKFECIENTKEYPYNFGKVRAIRTVFKEEFTPNLKINHGVYIDVFPMDCVDDAHNIKLNYIRKNISHYTQLRYAKLNVIHGIRYIPFKILPLKLINYRIKKLMMYYFNNGDKVQKLCHYGRNKPAISKSLFTDIIRVPFEKYEFNIPREYDSFLTGRYGDYMALPPLQDRHPVHDIKEISL